MTAITLDRCEELAPGKKRKKINQNIIKHVINLSRAAIYSFSTATESIKANSIETSLRVTRFSGLLEVDVAPPVGSADPLVQPVLELVEEVKEVDVVDVVDVEVVEVVGGGV